MRLHVFEIEGKIMVKALAFFSLKGARLGDVRRLARQTEERLKLFNKVLFKKNLWSKKELQIVVLNCFEKVFLMDKRLKRRTCHCGRFTSFIMFKTSNNKFKQFGKFVFFHHFQPFSSNRTAGKYTNA